MWVIAGSQGILKKDYECNMNFILCPRMHQECKSYLFISLSSIYYCVIADVVVGIAYTRPTQPGDLNIYVTNIVTGGVAHEDGRLRFGDRLGVSNTPGLFKDGLSHNLHSIGFVCYLVCVCFHLFDISLSLSLSVYIDLL